MATLRKLLLSALGPIAVSATITLPTARGRPRDIHRCGGEIPVLHAEPTGCSVGLCGCLTRAPSSGAISIAGFTTPAMRRSVATAVLLDTQLT
ncbi:hypothetical protein L227DRAFT_320401 [Lentinus tigrinus ALCF2SS1-6]|uniref:Secreted protein n=1 Tax=Lentinus tigrinus ALCF2SS1-6 TaxID=1328759 RepID=A0A5C2SM14_9APHY|nr:hypothetical protein L227DRAFT_320401 [Lentinus tigrinus ALCF2SS1-6]